MCWNNFHGKWVEMYVMSRLLGIMGLSGKFGKWKIIGWFSASRNGGIEVSQLFCSFCRFHQFLSTRVYGFHYMGSSSSALKKCNGHSLFGGVQWPWGTIHLFYKSLDLLCFWGRKETSNFFFLFSKQTQTQRTSFILQITHPFSGWDAHFPRLVV